MKAEDVVVLRAGSGWAVVAKPPRVLVHRTAESAATEVLLQSVRDRLGCRVYPIHRLDHQASGCVLFATSPERARDLQTALGSARKVYLALVRGELREEGPIVVEKPMKDDNGHLKDAKTTIRRVARASDPRCSVLVAEPHTGRYHQVRRHARDLNHPIVGDTKHGDSRINRWWREERGMTRLALHALHLEVPLPGEDAIEAVCPLFDDMAAVLGALPFADALAEAVPEIRLPPLSWAPDDGT